MESIENNNTEEISLIDLFSVLIKHRKLICFGTGIVVILTALYLFILPVFFKGLSKQTCDVTYTVTVNDVPVNLNEKIYGTKKDNSKNSDSIINLATYSVNRLPLLVEIHKKNPVFNDEDIDNPYLYNKFMQEIVRTGKFKVEQSLLGNQFDIILKIQEKDITKANEFVKEILAASEKQIEDFIFPKITNLKSSAQETVQQMSDSSYSDNVVLQNNKSLIIEIDSYFDNFRGFLVLTDAPFVIPEGKGRAKLAIIIVFAAIFIFIFIAFLLNAVENIKKDPVASKTISDAWNYKKK